MAESNAEQVVKPGAESTPAQPVDTAAPTPSSEKLEANGSPDTAGDAEKENRVPQHRLNEVIEQRNKERAENEKLLKRLEALENAGQGKAAKESRSERYMKKLISEGVEESAAKVLAKVSEEMATEIASEYVTPILQREVKAETDTWISELKKSAPDYDAVEPEMNKLFSGMSEEEKNFVVRNQRGLRMLYAEARLAVAGKETGAAKEAGKAEAYQTKELKKQLSSGGGGAAVPPKKPLTRKDINDMPLDEYQSRKAEILELARQGKLR